MDTNYYKVVITEQAEDDLEEIYNYINNELKANKAARNLKNKIKMQILDLIDNPYSCAEICTKMVCIVVYFSVLW